MKIDEASIIIGNIPINSGDDCYSIAEYQQAKAMAIKSLEAWGNLKNEITMLPFFNREEVINIIDKHLSEVSE